MVLRMKLVRAVAALVPLLLLGGVLLAGCGGGSTQPEDPVAQAYFDGIATQTVRSLTSALAAAEPGSPAAAYATYLRASSQAATDGGHPVAQSAQTAEQTSRGYRFCQASGSDKTCFEYADIIRSGGKIVTFTVNGKPITDRLAVGSAGPVAFRGLDAHATFLAAYQTTASDSLLVAVRIESGAGVRLGAVEASYRVAAGSPVPSAQSFGPATLDAASAANYLFAFPKASLGGRLVVSTTDTATGARGVVTLAVR